MAFDLTHFSLTFATGLLFCLGGIILLNALLGTRGFELFAAYKPLEAVFAGVLAVAFIMGFLAEDAFDSSSPDLLDQMQPEAWQPIDVSTSNSEVADSVPDKYAELKKLLEYLVPDPKEKIRFRSLFGVDRFSIKQEQTPHSNNSFINYYNNLHLFSNFFSRSKAYETFIEAIKGNGNIVLIETADETRKNNKIYLIKIKEDYYSVDSLNKDIKDFVNQIYYHSKNLVFTHKNYFDELTDRERRVNFSRAITYVSLTLFVLMFIFFMATIFISCVRILFAPFGETRDRFPFSSTSYLIIPMLSFLCLTVLAKNAFQFEQEQVNKRVFGYTTTLALLARKADDKDAFKRYFLGIDPDPGRTSQTTPGYPAK
jgi:hypothetical protein